METLPSVALMILPINFVEKHSSSEKFSFSLMSETDHYEKEEKKMRNILSKRRKRYSE